MRWRFWKASRSAYCSRRDIDGISARRYRVSGLAYGGHVLQMRVNFLIAGTQKGGTSALDLYLREQPQICMADHKEVHFFDRDRYFPEGTGPDYSFYHQFFSPRAPDRVVGECTPVYMYWRDAPRRIWQYNPDMKLIFILRNPIFRAFSHWNMQRQKTRDLLPFWLAIRTESERCRDVLPLQSKVFSYIDRGLYFQQLQRCWAHFPKTQTLVLRCEELKTSPRDALNKVCSFLGVEMLDVVQEKDVNSRPYVNSMAKSDWLYLRGIFEPDIRALEGALEWDCTDWLTEPYFD